MLLRVHNAAPMDPRPGLGHTGTQKRTNGVSTNRNNNHHNDSINNNDNDDDSNDDDDT